jgi:hypothetical protein
MHAGDPPGESRSGSTHPGSRMVLTTGVNRLTNLRYAPHASSGAEPRCGQPGAGCGVPGAAEPVTGRQPSGNSR